MNMIRHDAPCLELVSRAMKVQVFRDGGCHSAVAQMRRAATFVEFAIERYRECAAAQNAMLMAQTLDDLSRQRVEQAIGYEVRCAFDLPVREKAARASTQASELVERDLILGAGHR